MNRRRKPAARTCNQRRAGATSSAAEPCIPPAAFLETLSGKLDLLSYHDELVRQLSTATPRIRILPRCWVDHVNWEEKRPGAHGLTRPEADVEELGL